jgi:serine/threonine-protein kinase HipA
MQYVRPARVHALTRRTGGSISWLTEASLAVRIRALATPGAPGRLEGDAGYFSLAGQQPKSALAYDETKDRWGVPDGREPTTIIIKPSIGGDLRYVVAEHLSLALANTLGLSAAESFIVRAEDQIALAVVRYDRQFTPGGWVRVHQEDVCQALGISPQLKYEKGGGPGIAAIVRLLQTYSAAPEIDIWRFLDAIALNWTLIGTDAHARNYSLLIGGGGSARLAPLYDVASVLDIAESARLHTVNLAMQIGGNFTATKIRRAQWMQLALDLGRDPSELRLRVESLVRRVPDAIAVVAENARKDHTLPDRSIDALEQKITDRANRCLRVL